MTKTVFALLEKDTALTVFTEAGKEAVSPNPVVRAVIDNDLGFVCLAKARPGSEQEERVIRLETSNPQKALDVLPTVPGVKQVSTNFSTLVA